MDKTIEKYALKKADVLLERLYKKCQQMNVLDKAEITHMFDHRLRMKQINEEGKDEYGCRKGVA